MQAARILMMHSIAILFQMETLKLEFVSFVFYFTDNTCINRLYVFKLVIWIQREREVQLLNQEYTRIFVHRERERRNYYSVYSVIELRVHTRIFIHTVNL